MPIPEFILTLREKIGQDLLWLPGVTGLVLDEAGRILLVRRADNLQWALVTGCLEPGEQPGAGIVREILEETGVVAQIERVIAVESTPRMRHANGDQAVYMDVAFLCRAVSGEARVNDDESVDVGWFAPEDLPALPARQEGCVRRHLEGAQETWYAQP
ncbi:NUDIX domain-containing protein [Actinospica durhamensis]|uniref:NUDIX domain-containing protein n=1 Tax=Actinospica durhamensis TaxID=1508375 RepID=A0A941EMP7_9ACTN|nr:NUDIX domain-containing protein [Actinospica durhamensis]MBR7833845.1 NUDIX domain-containing protein [Actinospica durhamensis]